MIFTGRTAVITGGANGIGRCVLEGFIERGAKVSAIDIDRDSLTSLGRVHGADHIFFHGDAGRREDLEDFAGKVKEKFGKVDFLINNACISRRGIISNCGYDDFIEVLRVGLVAPYYLCMLFKDYFARNASVVNISSTRASQSQRDTESYSAAKGGITSLTHALAMSFAGNVRVNSIMPGWIDVSPWQQDGIDAQVSVPDMVQHPSGRIGRAEDVAAMVFFLCGHEAAFIDGESIVIDGGMTRRMIYHNDEGWALKADFS